jgi:hypothetical protein
MDFSKTVSSIKQILSGNGNKARLEDLEHILYCNLDAASSEESFYTLPIETIGRIVGPAAPDTTILKRIISNLIKVDENKAPLILKYIPCDYMSLDECICIISELKCYPICSKLGDLYEETNCLPMRDFEYELSQKDIEI